jgi:hypothetical protein
MNIIDCIDNNTFLKSIFPAGIEEGLIGQFGLDQGRFSINIHTKTKPAKPVAKWGVWGEDYNVIVIEMLGTGLMQIDIQNWDKYESASITCKKNEMELQLTYGANDWALRLKCRGLAFQKCSTYIA